MIRQLNGVLIKEALLLLRDRAGLAVLFAMPVLLIFLMVVIQDRTFHFLQDVRVPLLVVNADSGQYGQQILSGLKDLPQIELVDGQLVEHLNQNSLRQKVAAGLFKAGLFIPSGFSKKADDTQAGGTDCLKLFLDPAINQNLKLLIQSLVRENLARLEIGLLQQRIRQELVLFGPQAQQLLPENITDGKSRLGIKSIMLTRNQQVIMPNSVQHNVPGWTLFAMFFIVIPLSGTMIQERDSGLHRRVFSMPVALPVLLAGRGTVYFLVCVLQFLLMAAIGSWVMPLMHFPALQTGTHPLALVLVVASIALAAIGYGGMVGAWARTHQQASSFGAISILIAAALGGIWVPVFIMPEVMQNLSIISPLNWGLQAFHEVFLRDGDVLAVMPQVVKLTVFAGITYGLTWYKFKQI